jgi:F0F1-type ATP synthase membrane subunit a
MSLLGRAMVQLQTLPLILISAAPLILTVLETAVAVIQAYVFITLITLYSTEVT